MLTFSHMEIHDWDRKERMVEAFLSGRTMADIGIEHKLTRERVRQVLRSCGVDTTAVVKIKHGDRIVQRGKDALIEVSKRKSVGERFREKYEVDAKGCWVWKTGTVNGYGSFHYKNGQYAHRFSYEFFTGNKIPSDREIDHICRNKLCVNPEHLEVVTHRENVLRGPVPHLHEIYPGLAEKRRKLFCKRGHPRTGKNIRLYKDRHGKIWRYCRPCDAARYQENKAKSRPVDKPIDKESGL